MDCTVVYSQRSLSDLHEITAFIAADNAEAAVTFGNRLVDLTESLRRMPERGRPVKNWKDVRVVVLAPYLIFYHFEMTSKRVEILCFWHGARDPESLEL
jgi:plasmid stabilization system protein ParE